MKFTDNSISQLVRVLQLAILTGTDITDNIRMMEFVEVEGKLDLDSDYVESFESSLKKLEDELPKPESLPLTSPFSQN